MLQEGVRREAPRDVGGERPPQARHLRSAGPGRPHPERQAYEGRQDQKLVEARIPADRRQDMFRIAEGPTPRSDRLTQDVDGERNARHPPIGRTKQQAAEIPAFLAVMEVPTVAANIDAELVCEPVHEREGVVAIDPEAIEKIDIDAWGSVRRRVMREECRQVGWCVVHPRKCSPWLRNRNPSGADPPEVRAGRGRRRGATNDSTQGSDGRDPARGAGSGSSRRRRPEPRARVSAHSGDDPSRAGCGVTWRIFRQRAKLKTRQIYIKSVSRHMRIRDRHYSLGTRNALHER